MQTDMPRPHPPLGTTTVTTGIAPTQSFEPAVDVVLDDLFLSVGQAIGLRASMDFNAVVWLRNHFRLKFLAAMHRQGDRWLEDRVVVTAVAALFAERAVRYSSGDVIAVDDVRQAAADVERYCRAHARRAASRTSDAATALIAGYWCTWDPEP